MQLASPNEDTVLQRANNTSLCVLSYRITPITSNSDILKYRWSQNFLLSTCQRHAFFTPYLKKVLSSTPVIMKFRPQGSLPRGFYTWRKGVILPRSENEILQAGRFQIKWYQWIPADAFWLHLAAPYGKMFHERCSQWGVPPHFTLHRPRSCQR